MAALKNRTVETESLAEDVIGKAVTFTDTEGNDWEGEVYSINADGSYRIDTGDEAWDLEDGEFEFVDETITSDIAEDEESPEEEKLAEAIPVEPEEEVLASDKNITASYVESCNLIQLKQLIKERQLKGIPLRAYQEGNMLRDCVFDILGFSRKEKTVEEKSGSLDPAKKIVIKKEKKIKIKTEKIQRKPKGIIFEMYQEYTKLLLESPKTSKELLNSVAGKAKKTILTGTIYHFIRSGIALGVIIQEGEKYSIKYKS